MKLSIKIKMDDYGVYQAICPSLPGCMTKGMTREEARAKLDEAIRGYFAALNNFVPEDLGAEIVEVG